MSDTARHAQLVAWLEDQGHTAEEIDKILAKVRAYDAQTAHDSVFDSIDAGHFDLEKIIAQALETDTPEAELPEA